MDHFHIALSAPRPAGTRSAVMGYDELIASLEAEYREITSKIARIAISLCHLERDESVSSRAIELLERQQDTLRDVAATLLSRLGLAISERAESAK